MTARTLTHKPPAPWHWDGHDPLDKPIVAQSLRAPTVRNVRVQEVTVTDTPEPEGWDIDGLDR